jgi:two-component system CheB/CheR fusion protein
MNKAAKKEPSIIPSPPFSDEIFQNSNNELQNLNEELQTNQEELQTINEELHILNQQLNERNDLLVESRRFAEATISILHEPLLALDKNFRIQTANKSFYKIFQLTEAETLGKLLFELQGHGWDIPGLKKELNKIQKGKQKMAEAEITFTFPVIGERSICFNIQAINKANGEQLILLALDDVTVKNNTARLKEQKKDEFISIASHEMKTPLTTAKGYLQLLEQSLEKSDETANLYAKKASHAVGRLNELVNDLLDSSKLQFGRLNYNITTFDFNEMVDEAIEDIQHTAKVHLIVKTGNIAEQITGDKERLKQVVINLLTNAIKYSPKGKKVFLSLAKKKGAIKLSVKDDGIGISKYNLEKIFDKYFRVEEQSLMYQGLGIGLFISQEIIQRHHGKLWAESKPGKGSTFHFTLPVSSR